MKFPAVNDGPLFLDMPIQLPHCCIYHEFRGMGSAHKELALISSEAKTHFKQFLRSRVSSSTTQSLDAPLILEDAQTHMDASIREFRSNHVKDGQDLPRIRLGRPATLGLVGFRDLTRMIRNTISRGRQRSPTTLNYSDYLGVNGV